METQNKTVTNNSGDLGKINPEVLTAIINGVSRLIPFIVGLFNGGNSSKDTWSGWSTSQKTQYVQEGLIVAKEAIRQGAATTIEETMRVLIAQVELDESWEVWKDRNKMYIPMMQQAQTEINSEMSNSLASIISSKALLWVLGFSVVGFGFYWFRFRDKPDQLPQQNIITKKLT